MRRRLIALALGLAFCLAGCANPVAPPPEETPAPAPSASAAPESRQFALPYYEGASLHPITGDNRVNLALAGLVYQGLFELDNTFTPHEVLCSGAAASEDGLTWTLKLKSARFSDGTALTAADVAASLELARTSALYAARLARVRAVSAGEDNTVTITLERPNGALTALLDIPIVRESGDGAPPLGTGPYAFAGEGDSLRLVRGDAAPGGAPEVIPLKAVSGADGLIYAFDAGEVSLVGSDLTGANALGYSSGCEVFDFPTTDLLFVGFRTEDGPCKDALVRQAVSRAFDRDTVALSLLEGHGEATCLPFSPRSPLYSAGREEAGAYSPAAAAELLAQAGYAAGEDGLLYRDREALALDFIVSTDNPYKLSAAEYLAGELNSLGMSVTLRRLAWDDYTAALEAGEFDLFLGETLLTADFDLTPLLSRDGALNYGGYSNAEMDDALAVLGAADASRQLRAEELLRLFQREAPFAPLCFKNHSALVRWGAITGLEPTRQNLFYHLDELCFGP